MTRLVVAAIVVATTLSLAASAGAVNDPPRIVPWHMIGNVGLGMSKERVQYVYGYPNARNEYVAGDGVLAVIYDRQGHVSTVATTSSRYAVSGGRLRIGVTRIPLGGCHRERGHCERRWDGGGALNGFVFGAEEGVWFKRARWGGRSVAVSVYVRAGGVVRAVSLAYV